MGSSKDRFLRDAVETELAYYPEVSWRYETTKNHPRYVIAWRGKVWFHVVPASTGDHRSWLAQITALKRQMRERGVPRIDDPQAYEREMRRRKIEAQRAAEAGDPEAGDHSRSSNIAHFIKPEETPVSKPVPPPEDPRDLLRRLQREQTLDRLVKWQGVQANQDRIVEAALLLVSGWHPDIVLRAADLILDAEQPLREAQDHQQRKVQR